MATARITCSAGENISTYGTGKTYTPGQLSNWEADTDVDLSIADRGEILEVYGTGHDDRIETISGTTNIDATRFRIIRPATGNFYTTGTPTPHFSITSGGEVFDMREARFSLQDLVLKATENGAPNETIVFDVSGGDHRVIGCIMIDGSNSGSGTMRGVDMSNSGSSYYVDCLVHNTDGWGLECRLDTFRAYNCTVTNCAGNGFSDGGSGRPVLKNCLATGNGTDFTFNSAGPGSGSHSLASEDATADDGTTPATNADVSISTTNLYEDSANDDFHITSSATADVLGDGTDLSADGDFSFDDDIDLATISTWSKGFDCDPAAAGGVAPTGVLYGPLMGPMGGPI